MREPNQLILVTGGVRSGKSSFAETLALEKGGPIAYIATSRIEDEEMADRVRRHQDSRPKDWVTIEAPWDLAGALQRLPDGTRTVIVDCLGVFVSNLLLKYAGDGDPTAGEVETQILNTIQSFLDAQVVVPVTMVVVTNETGLGVVPPSALGRAFRDYLGWANQMVAKAADKAYLVVAGIPLLIKGSQ
ncbi:MAG: bifunctional adenosylcobinamide kinase/adenosylcobinamide-phosphate guanylyltransferase [Firmicutes bacterium]|jgi:adenosylcobinamide kinase/adenosylcobinamide-phosphate guanylyltransferase|nr:bifunctional adenosylcobinamide kinase/adenosylcobinamide-phosphate guanylyltransferase [Bacillota bacterium]